MAEQREPKRYYMIGEISKMLKVPLGRLQNLQAHGKLPVGVRVGRFHAYPKSDFEEIAHQCKQVGWTKVVHRDGNLGMRKMDSKRAKVVRRMPKIDLDELADADDSIAIEDDE